ASDVVEAEAATERFAAAPSDGSRVRDVWLLRLRALVARARSDQASYRIFVSGYRAMAKSLGYECHIAGAAGMRSYAILAGPATSRMHTVRFGGRSKPRKPAAPDPADQRYWETAGMQTIGGHVRAASPQDAAACVAVYRPYVDTAVSWELEVPT